MKKIHLIKFLSCFSIFLLSSSSVYSQSHNPPSKGIGDNIQFGGTFGVGIGSGFTNISLAPSAIYKFNPYFAAGLGIQGSYLRQRDLFEAYLYGITPIVLVNPSPQVQISAELEQLRAHLNYDNLEKEKFWNTGLFIGVGYQAGNVTTGIRYNVLYNNNDRIYGTSWMPFFRVYF